MKDILLDKIKQVINDNCRNIRARVPEEETTYMELYNNHLVQVKSKYLLLTIDKTSSKKKLKIYYNDIVNVIKRLSRKNENFSQRLNSLDITAHDVDLIIRRASYNSLKLATDFYL